MTYKLGKIFDELDRRLSEDPTLGLSQLAHNLGCSHPTIERAVRTYALTSFRAFRNQKRVEKVVFLEEKGWSAKQIGLELGYKWPGNFARFMKHSKSDAPPKR